MKRRVVFFVSKMIMGGYEMVLKNLLDQLKGDRNLKISVVGRVEEKYFLDYFAENSDRITLIPFSSRGLFSRIRRAIFGLPPRIRKLCETADVAVDYKDGAMRGIVRKCRGKKIVWIHGNFDMFMRRGPRTLLKYDRIVALTDEFRNEFVRRFPNRADRCVRIYNAVPYKDISRAAGMARGPDARASGRFFVSVMRLDGKQKDAGTIIRAFDMLGRAAANVRLILIGDGPEMPRLKKLAAKNPDIIFAGKIPNPFDYMRGALANILSSRYEGLPTVLIEGAAAGALNIAADCPFGPREILLDGRAGILFPVGDAARLSEIMSDVIAGKINRNEMIANGTAALPRFDAKKNADAVREILK